MGKIALAVQKEFCGECTLALTRFIGKMPGVNSIEVGEGQVVVDFNEGIVLRKDIRNLTKDSIEKLGYRAEEMGEKEEE